MNLSPMIYFLLERMGCQKEDRCFLSGSTLGRNTNKQKVAAFYHGSVFVFVFFHIVRLVFPIRCADAALFLLCSMVQVVSFNVKWNTEGRKGEAASWLI